MSQKASTQNTNEQHQRQQDEHPHKRFLQQLPQQHVPFAAFIELTIHTTTAPITQDMPTHRPQTLGMPSDTVPSLASTTPLPNNEARDTKESCADEPCQQLHQNNSMHQHTICPPIVFDHLAGHPSSITWQANQYHQQQQHHQYHYHHSLPWIEAEFPSAICATTTLPPPTLASHAPVRFTSPRGPDQLWPTST